MRYFVPGFLIIFLCLAACFAADYISLKKETARNSERIAEIEATARPLVVLGKYGRVTVNGRDVDMEVPGE